MPGIQTPPQRCPSSLQLTATLDLQAEAANGVRQPRFSLYANSGEPMQLDGFAHPVIIDLRGAEFAKPTTPVIADHDPRLRIGHTTQQQVTADGITASGLVSSGSGVARGFVEDAKGGFPFETSVGAKILEGSFVPEGRTVTVNGREWSGPLIVARRTLIRELSVAVLGADSRTSAVVAATQGRGGDINLDPSSPEDSVPVQAAVTAERARIQQIDALLQPPAAGWGHVQTEVANLRASAVHGDISLAQLPSEVCRLSELEQLRASRHVPSGPGIHSHGPPDGRTLEAAIARHVNVDVGRLYGEQTAEAAARLNITCLMDAMKIAAQMGGFQGNFKSKDAVIKAAFSTAEIATLLSNVAGKQSEEAYRAFPSIVRQVARKLSANDFKQKTGIRLTGDATFLKVAGSGEIKHGTLHDQSFTYKIDTYARMWGLDRQTIINDDLQALDDIPRMLGRGGALAVEEVFWGLVLANTGSFFAAGNNNLLTGAGSVLSGTSLGSGVKLFLEQTDTHGKPIGVTPRFLVVPPALKVLADELYTTRQWNVGGGNTDTESRLPSANAFFGLYEPLTAPWLGVAGGLTGGSDTAWYLLGSPQDVAAFGIAYLDDMESPTVEPADVQFNLLGVQWRGYLDFGVCQVDHRGGVKSDGA